MRPALAAAACILCLGPSLRAQTTYTAYHFSTLAGSTDNPATSGTADGTGSAARFNAPFGIVLDSANNAYVADAGNHTIRRIAAGGVVTTLAGTAGTAGSADGTGTAATFNAPSGLAVDSAGNLYVADTGNHTIRKITSAGVVTTLAGTAGASGAVNGTGAAARFNSPYGLALDAAGNLYVADTGNHLIRKVTSAGVVTTFAGTAGVSGSADGQGTAARFNSPESLLVDRIGDVYVADTGNHIIRQIFTTGRVVTIAGTAGTAGSKDASSAFNALFASPAGLAIDGSDNLYVSDSANQTVRLIAANGVVTTLAGSPGASGTADGSGAVARFNLASALAVDASNNVYLVDTNNHRIRLGNPNRAPVASNAAATTGVDQPVIFAIPATDPDADALTYTVTAVSNGTATISGTQITFTPAAGFAGTASVTFTATDGYATSGAGTVTITVVNLVPVITAQPASRTVTSGTKVTLSVTATSTSTIAYQWFLNGSAISGATSSSLVLDTILVRQAGNYTVVLTNGSGSVTSSVAALTVTAGDYRGTYSGTVNTSDGSVALTVRSDGTMTLLSFLPNRKLGFLVNTTVDADGVFQATGAQFSGTGTTTSPTFRGRIINRVLSGTIDTLNLPIAATATPTSSSAPAGLYTLSALGTASSTTYLLVCTNGAVVALITDGSTVDGGTGTVQADGTLTLTTALSTRLAGSIGSSGQVSLTQTPSGGSAVTVAGVLDSVTAVQRIASISARSFVDVGENVLIVGFAVQGTAQQQMLIRAAGPALSGFGVSGVIAQPKLQVYKNSTLIATNAGWSTATNATAIGQAADAIGLFPFAANSKDSAVLVTLDPGTYSAVISGADGGTGVGLVEAYYVSGSSAGRATSFSCRNFVGQGDKVLIAGLAVSGNTPKKLLVRAVGPTLSAFGVSAPLVDPQLQIYQNSTVIAQNDNWGNDAQVIAAVAKTGDFPLSATSKDAALVITLAPGSYSIVVSGVGGATGIALVEAYEVP